MVAAALATLAAEVLLELGLVLGGGRVDMVALSIIGVVVALVLVDYLLLVEELLLMLLVLEGEDVISLDHVVDAVVVAETHVYVLVEVGPYCASGAHSGRASTYLIVLIRLVHRVGVVLLDHLATQAFAILQPQHLARSNHGSD